MNEKLDLANDDDVREILEECHVSLQCDFINPTDVLMQYKNIDYIIDIIEQSTGLSDNQKSLAQFIRFYAMESDE